MGILTTKSIARQVGYYYNIWKTLSTDRARLWYYDLKEVRRHKDSRSGCLTMHGGSAPCHCHHSSLSQVNASACLPSKDAAHLRAMYATLELKFTI